MSPLQVEHTFPECTCNQSDNLEESGDLLLDNIQESLLSRLRLLVALEEALCPIVTGVDCTHLCLHQLGNRLLRNTSGELQRQLGRHRQGRAMRKKAARLLSSWTSPANVALACSELGAHSQAKLCD